MRQLHHLKPRHGQGQDQGYLNSREAEQEQSLIYNQGVKKQSNPISTAGKQSRIKSLIYNQESKEQSKCNVNRRIKPLAPLSPNGLSRLRS